MGIMNGRIDGVGREWGGKVVKGSFADRLDGGFGSIRTANDDDWNCTGDLSGLCQHGSSGNTTRTGVAHDQCDVLSCGEKAESGFGGRRRQKRAAAIR